VRDSDRKRKVLEWCDMRVSGLGVSQLSRHALARYEAKRRLVDDRYSWNCWAG